MRKSSQENQFPPSGCFMTQERRKPVHKRGLLDILDIHACVGSEIGGTKQRIRTSGSKDGIPYEPSLKSMPCSSSSEESLEKKKSSVGKDKISQYNKHSSRLSNKNTEESLFDLCSLINGSVHSEIGNTGSLGSIIRHFNSNRNWKKQLNKEGSVTSDIIPEQSNESLLDDKWSQNFADNAKCDVRNNKSNIHSTLNIDVQSIAEKDVADESPSFDISDKDLIYGFKDIDNFISDKDLKRYETESEKKIGQQKSTNTLYSVARGGGDELHQWGYLKGDSLEAGNFRKPVLHLFDCNGYPLTDSKGNILQTANGQNLVIFKNGRPHYDLFKRLVFDKNGETSLSPKFKPYSIISKTSDVKFELPLYDFRGYPLSDYDGSSLINSKGLPLIVTNQEGKILHDFNGHPIFDEFGIPLTQINNRWLTPLGLPYRVFDNLNYPLTNSCGEPLHNIIGEQMLRCDKYGRPILDCNSKPVVDSSGFIPTDSYFNPTLSNEFEKRKVVALIKNRPVKIYNKWGLPLTEDDGIVLKDATGKYLLGIQSDCCHETILNCSFGKMNNYCTSINENLGEDGTKRLSHNYSKYYQKPLIDSKGEFVYDIEGRQLFLESNKKYELNSKRSCYTKYHQRSCSSSETKSVSSYTSDQMSGNYTSMISENLDIDLQKETDMFGRPLFDSMKRPLFDKYGRPIFDLFLRPIYYRKGCPIADAEGKLLCDGSDEIEGEKINFNALYLSRHSSHMLLHQTDLNGGPLFDRTGEPLYNKKGKPLKDAFGRPLYDEKGKPLCNEDGLPASEQIKKKSLKIDNVEDKFQRLIVNSDTSTHRGPCDNEVNKLSEESVQHYKARVRITTFVNGEQVIELLELAPAFNIYK